MIVINKTCALVALAMTFGVTLYTQGYPSASSLLPLVRKNYDPGHSISTKFTLTIYWSVREKEEKKQGSIMLAPNDRFFVTAGSETYASNGQTYWQYNATANQVVIKRLADVDRSCIPSQIFSKYINTCPFRPQERKNGVTLFSWKADSSGSPYESIRVRVREKSGTIAECVMIDRNGNRFTYTFSGTVFDNKISKEAFEFAIPKSARVIDMRK